MLVSVDYIFFFFCKQKTAYEMRISDGSSDVCSSDLFGPPTRKPEKPIQVAKIASAATITERIRPAGMLAQASLEWINALMKPSTQVAGKVEIAPAPGIAGMRPAERRVGNECVRHCRSQLTPDPYKHHVSTHQPSTAT